MGEPSPGEPSRWLGFKEQQLRFEGTQEPCVPVASLWSSLGATLHSPSLQTDNYAETPLDFPDHGR